MLRNPQHLGNLALRALLLEVQSCNLLKIESASLGSSTVLRHGAVTVINDPRIGAKYKMLCTKCVRYRSEMSGMLSASMTASSNACSGVS